MDLVANAPPRPFAVVELDRHRRMTALGVPAATARRTDEELTRSPEDVDRLAVGAPDDVARLRGVGRAGQTGDGIGGRLVVLVFVVEPGGVLGRAPVELLGCEDTR